MATAADILRSWRGPRAMTRRQLDRATEGRALAFLMGALVLVFVAQWPRLARAAELDPSIPFDARAGGALVGIVFFMPLVFYGLAALSHLVARAMGGQGSWQGARVALFWSLLATSPLFLLDGLVGGIIGPGPQQTLTGVLVAAGFLGHWGLALVEAETSRPSNKDTGSGV